MVWRPRSLRLHPELSACAETQWPRRTVVAQVPAAPFADFDKDLPRLAGKSIDSFGPYREREVGRDKRS